MRQLVAEDQFAEIFVAGNHNATFCDRSLQDRFIIQPTGLVVNGQNIMSFNLKPSGNYRTSAFVHKESHRKHAYSWVSTRLPQQATRIHQTRLHILRC
jgi:hypothetical protein